MGNESSNEDKSIPVFLLLYALLMIIAIVLTKLLHDRPTLGAIIPEAGMVISVGMVAGLLVRLLSASSQQSIADSLLNFSSNVFFDGLLPPIICKYWYSLFTRSTSHNSKHILISSMMQLIRGTIYDVRYFIGIFHPFVCLRYSGQQYRPLRLLESYML
jgi:hypothetical protein